MKRDIEETLVQWKKDKRRMPLLVRGARQVGKSYTVNKFGKDEFENLVTINFEQESQYKACFDSLLPKEVIESLSLLHGTDIIPGKTLLFLDEIQECPRAITALRYFYEQMPELHVIGAGSLLEFTLAEVNFKMPVGRVEYLYMRPLSFLEFLDALGESRLRKMIENVRWDYLPQPVIHDRLVSLVKKYALLGGMPKVIAEYTAGGSLDKCHRIQTSIIQTYLDDFGKYSSRVKHKYLEKIFYATPKMVGRKFKYSHVDSHMQSRDLKEALQLLEKAGVVYRVKRTGGEGLPLEANAEDRHFKVVFLDIGLMRNLCGLSKEMLLSDDLITIDAGAVAEQFTAQELLAYRDVFQAASLYYWARESRSSNAEVDYLIPCGTNALPVEVKAGKTGTLRSLHSFLDKYPVSAGLRVSQQPFTMNLPVISIPFYGIKKISSLVGPYL